MDIRTFRAATLQEALEQVRETLGPDAAVLHTRQVKRSRMGLFSSKLIEVEASIEMPQGSRFATRAKARIPASPYPDSASPYPDSDSPVSGNADSGNAANKSSSPAGSSKGLLQSRSQNAESTEGPVQVSAEAIGTTAVDNASLPAVGGTRPHTLDPNPLTQNVLGSASPANDESSTKSPAKNNAGKNNTGRLPPAMYETLSEMLDAGVEPTEAKALLHAASQMLELEQLNDALLLQGRLCQIVSKNLQIAEPIVVREGQQTVVAMVGTTGVGKTTTLAKLATNFQAEHGSRVGLVTLDTYRPGAVDQLLQYAESLDAALEVVSSANQFLPALHRLKDCDAVFIDTAGRSPNDTEQIRVLQELLEAAQPTSVQLVVSATSSLRHVETALERFEALHPTALVITKLDEAVEFGSWLPLLQNSSLPVSYLSYGQHVPADLAIANRRKLASLLLGH